MSKETEYEFNKDIVYHECGVRKKDKHSNMHHIYFRNDEKKHKLPPNFPINDRCNLIPLPVPIHEKLHWIVENDPNYKDIQLRTYLANMAFNGDIQDIPDRLYTSDPEDMIKKFWNGE